MKPRMIPPAMAPEITPAPPIITIMKALIEVGPPMPRLTPVIVTSSPPTSPASIAPVAKPIIE